MSSCDDFRPKRVPKTQLQEALNKAELDKTSDPLQRLLDNQVLEQKDIGAGTLIAFALDPIAEYAAAFAHAQDSGRDEKRWDELWGRVADQGENAAGFSEALRVVHEIYARDFGWASSVVSGPHCRSILVDLLEGVYKIGYNFEVNVASRRTPSSWFYGQDYGLSLLGDPGLKPESADYVLAIACALNVVLGVATLVMPVRILWLIQLGVMLFYSVTLTTVASQLWLDPFGPLVKNLPIAVVLIGLLAAER